ncbi:hypothetical protein FRB90_005770 [Tulasnella sp. 427]|nr:hypothetical protein FRB90_005770 [Tulasnella sp. 427]
MALFRARLDDEDVLQQVENGTLNLEDLAFMNRIEDPASFPVTGFFLGIAAAHGLRIGRAAAHRALPLQIRLALSKPVFGIAGGYVGHKYAQYYARKNLDSLQNPQGYKAAMMEIHKAHARRNGEEIMHVNWTYGLMIAKKLTKKELEAMDESSPLPYPEINPEEADLGVDRNGSNGEAKDARPASNSTPGAPPVQSTSPNRWEEIRKERTTAQPTTWDLIRQKHERERLPASVPTSASHDDQSSNGWGSETAREPTSSADSETTENPKQDPGEQERFDALLEAERRRSAEADAAQLFGDSTWKESSNSSRRWK